jgi:Na+/proline symporter
MVLGILDLAIIASMFILSLAIGLLSSRTAGKSATDFFLSGRNMPWWLLGVSMVATTFSADTPNLVTDIVRKNGVAGNWVWWAFLLTGMLTVFVYARLWRRSQVNTDIEFYEIRYGGKPAAFLRGFRALYLGVFFNIVIMASVSLAAIKIGAILLGLTPLQTILIASVITVTYSSLGGLKGVLFTDFFQFIIAMVGSIAAAVYVVNLPQVGGLGSLLSHPGVQTKMNFLPDFTDTSTLIPMIILPLAIQWWSVWYPGAEPGGGGYIAQRMLSAKDEKNALGATLLFNVAHYALRPWPWILIALASLIVFPDLASIATAFPGVPEGTINDDLAYSAMLTFLPAGLLGVVVASLIAAYMSTISTHLNWGSSYVVNDFYVRFVNPHATDQQQVRMGRWSIIAMAAVSAVLALLLSNALQAFNILLQIGAGTGLIFILRWFWWRINAYTELTGMIVSFVIALWFELVGPALGVAMPEGHWKLLLGVGITTAAWLLVTLLTPPEKDEVLTKFYAHVGPSAAGWKPVLDRNPQLKPEVGQLPFEILLMFVGCITVYAALFATGFWLYGQVSLGMVATVIAFLGGIYLFKQASTLRFK